MAQYVAVLTSTRPFAYCSPLLFLSGSGLEIDDLHAFRQWGSRTPGHPEAATPRASR